MIKIELKGNVAFIVAEDIDFDVLANTFKNGVLITDEKNQSQLYEAKATKQQYGSIGKYGCTFNSKTADGKAMVSFPNTEKSAEEFSAKYADAIQAMDTHLPTVAKIIANRVTFLASVKDRVEVE
jgi:hypothetical protein